MKNKYLVMSPRRGSTPRQTDWLTVSRKVTLTLTIHNKQTHFLPRKDSVGKKISGHEFQVAWRQDEMIGGKPPVVK
jgi:hypothetical protein